MAPVADPAFAAWLYPAFGSGSASVELSAPPGNLKIRPDHMVKPAANLSRTMEAILRLPRAEIQGCRTDIAGPRHSDSGNVTLSRRSSGTSTSAQKAAVLEGFVDDFCAGVSKTRGNDTLAGLQWSASALITSNQSYAELLAEADLPPAESMGPRLIELPADLGTGHGVFKSLPRGFSDGAQVSDEMRATAIAVFGHAAPEFARALIEAERQDLAGISSLIASRAEEFVDWAGKDLTSVLGQLRDKIAAIYAAASLAKHLGVLPPGLKIKEAIAWAWRIVSQDRRTAQAQDPVAAVAAYIKRNRRRFLRTPLDASISESQAARLVGIRHTADGEVEYLIPKVTFGRAFRSIGGSTRVMPALLAEDLAKAENARAAKYQVKRQLRPGLRLRVYCISAAILKR